MDLTEVVELYNKGEIGTAFKSLESIEPRYNINHPEFFDLKLLKARMLIDMSKLDSSELLLNSLLDLARRSGKKIERLDTIILLTGILWRKGDWDRSFFMVEMGEYDFIKLGDDYPNIEKTKRYVHLKRLKGIYYRYNGELDLATEYFQESLVEAEVTKDKRLIAEIYNLIGLVLQENGELTQAWNYYIQSYQLYNSLQDPIGMAISLLNLGSIQEYIGEIDAAMQNYMQALGKVEDIGNRRLKAKAIANIGMVYQKKGETSIAFEHLTKSLAIMSDIGNDVETSWVLYQIIILLLNSEKRHLAPIFVDGLKELQQSNPQIHLISQHYRIVRATNLMHSDKPMDQAEAQQLFVNLINEDVIDHELTIYSMLKLLNLLLHELQITADPEILDEIDDLFAKLQRIVSEQYSYPLLIEILTLQAKFAILELDYSKALTFISHALEMAEQKNMQQIVSRISEEYDTTIKKIEEINTIKQQGAHLIASIEQSDLEERIAELISERKESYMMFQETPVILLVLSEDDYVFYSKKFTHAEDINDQLIQSFIKAINAIIKQTFPFPGPVERVKHGQYYLLVKEIKSYKVVYVFTGGNSYSAVQKLDNLISLIKEEDILSIDITNKSESNSFNLHLDKIIPQVF